LRTDDGTASHAPSSTVLWSRVLEHPRTGADFPHYRYTHSTYPHLPVSGVTLTAGALYHVVFSNADANPQANWVSLDNLQTAARTPQQVTIPDTDLAVLIKEREGQAYTPFRYSNGTGLSPIFTLDLANGQREGQGYVDTGVPLEVQNVSGAIQVRQKFTVTGGTRIAGSVAISLAKRGSPSALTVRLERADGTLVEEGAVPAHAIATTATWATYTFRAPRALEDGQSYNLVLSAGSGGGSYAVYPLFEGFAAQGIVANVFSDGYAQLSRSGGASWVNFPGDGNDSLHMRDLQFFFRLVGG
jgi:hypothetical protein